MGTTRHAISILAALVAILSAQIAQHEIGPTQQTPTVGEPSRNSTIQSLEGEKSRLQSSVDRWNIAYIVALCFAVVIGAATGFSQWKTIALSKRLGFVGAQLEAEKDRVVTTDLKGKDLRIGEANARAKLAEAQVAIANAASNDAVSKVAAAESHIAEANARAAEATRIAESERLQRIKLEGAIQPRSIGQQQALTLITACARFRGTTVHVRSVTGDLEAWRLGQQLINIFRAAGLVAQDETLNLQAIGGVPVGVQLFAPTPDPKAAGLESAIEHGLTSPVNFMSTQGPYKPIPPDEKVVAVLVGVRPLPNLE